MVLSAVVYKPKIVAVNFLACGLGLGPLAALATAVYLTGALTAPVAIAQTVWELQPYRVEIWLGVDATLNQRPKLHEELVRGIGEDLARYVGSIWEWDIRPVEPPLVRRFVVEGEWPKDLWPQHWVGLEHPDKAIVLAVTRSEDGFHRIFARELDLRSQSWGPRVKTGAATTEEILRAAFPLIWEAFCPVARLSSLDLERREGQLRIRAGGLFVRDPSLSLAHTGQIFRIYVRYNDRTGRAVRIVEVPFSYMYVNSLQETGLLAQLVSGLRSPLSARRRGRTEQLFVATKPYMSQTRLLLRDRRQPERPLVAYSVFAQDPSGGRLQYLGQTDAEGAIVIPWQSQSLKVLWVRNGQVPIARLPVALGAVPKVVAEIPSDDERLEAEGILLGVQQELLEVVTRRQLLIARIRRLLQLGQPERARQVFEQLQSLRSRDDLRRYLLTQRKRLVAREPATQKRIDQMFTKTEELLNVYLDPAPINELAAKLRK
ncbi:MAG: hypothetical protein NZ899_07590 [Thermoguttaceae bacterium]|nr:hypothetical protein [Thermoguttaceae bacterium]MDW8079006.1 hypothetical protein [Thermoguttaceae bacterium]